MDFGILKRFGNFYFIKSRGFSSAQLLKMNGTGDLV